MWAQKLRPRLARTGRSSSRHPLIASIPLGPRKWWRTGRRTTMVVSTAIQPSLRISWPCVARFLWTGCSVKAVVASRSCQTPGRRIWSCLVLSINLIHCAEYGHALECLGEYLLVPAPLIDALVLFCASLPLSAAASLSLGLSLSCSNTARRAPAPSLPALQCAPYNEPQGGASSKEQST